jgi:hypothetical protein
LRKAGQPAAAAPAGVSVGVAMSHVAVRETARA